MIFLKTKLIISRFINPSGKLAFASSLNKNAVVLDLGCGNSWSLKLKTLRPDLFYIGVDIQNYKNNNSIEYMDEFVLTSPSDFHMFSDSINGHVDACIWSHNIEHLERPFETLIAVCKSIKHNGQLYLSFPSHLTPELPSRAGTLNFADDPTHVYLPDVNELCGILKENGFSIELIRNPNRPIFPYLLGMLLEPLSCLCKRNLFGTWAFHGYETVLIARKMSHPANKP